MSYSKEEEEEEEEEVFSPLQGICFKFRSIISLTLAGAAEWKMTPFRKDRCNASSPLATLQCFSLVCLISGSAFVDV